MITLSTGATVTTLQDPSLGLLVILDHPDSPDDMRHKEAGRIVDFDGRWGFQPAPFAAYVLSPEALRAIADLVETEATS